MMKETRTLSLFLLGILVFLSLPARAEIGGDGCTPSSFGTSKVDSNGADIIVCLRSEAGSDVYQWKSLAGGGGVPSKTVAFFALTVCPDGWSLANGTNGTTDVRGYFIRALDLGAGRDDVSSRGVTSVEGDAMRNLTASFSMVSQSSSAPMIYAADGAMYVIRNSSASSMDYNGTRVPFTTLVFDASRLVPTATENRPKNIALLACQKD